MHFVSMYERSGEELNDQLVSKLSTSEADWAALWLECEEYDEELLYYPNSLEEENRLIQWEFFTGLASDNSGSNGSSTTLEDDELLPTLPDNSGDYPLRCDAMMPNLAVPATLTSLHHQIREIAMETHKELISTVRCRSYRSKQKTTRKARPPARQPAKEEAPSRILRGNSCPVTVGRQSRANCCQGTLSRLSRACQDTASLLSMAASCQNKRLLRTNSCEGTGGRVARDKNCPITAFSNLTTVMRKHLTTTNRKKLPRILGHSPRISQPSVKLMREVGGQLELGVNQVKFRFRMLLPLNLAETKRNIISNPKPRSTGQENAKDGRACRDLHNSAERLRRIQLALAFKQLSQLIPEIHCLPLPKERSSASKIRILQGAIHLCSSLAHTEQKLAEEKEVEQERKRRLQEILISANRED